MSPDAKLVSSLAHRISLKLPHKNEKDLESLENDLVLKQTVTALIEVSLFKLSIVLDCLLELLNETREIEVNGEYEFPPNYLQSQLFIFRLISACLHSNWQHNRDISSDVASSTVASSTGDYGSIARSIDSTKSSSKWSVMEDQRNLVDMADPPPLHPVTAKCLISNVINSLKHLNFLKNIENSQSAYHFNQISRIQYFTVANMTKLSNDIVLDNYVALNLITSYLTASNWPIFVSRVRTNLKFLSLVLDDEADSTTVRLVEYGSLNGKRLSSVLLEFREYFLDLRKPTQYVAAALLRKSIWSWIENYPSEFMQLCSDQRPLEGRPDLLFDMCYSIADTSKKKAKFWPLLTMLLVLCPDILTASVRGENIVNKKVAFLKTLKSSLKSDRMGEVATLCYVDICKAATYVDRNESPAIRTIVHDVEYDLKDKLFDFNKPLLSDNVMNSFGVNIDHRSLLADCLTAMFRLRPQHALRDLFPACLSLNAPNSFKIGLVKSCLKIVTEESRLPWNPSINVLYNAVSGPLRNLFVQLASKDFSKFETTPPLVSPAPPPSNPNSRKNIPNLSLNEKNSSSENFLHVVNSSHERSELILDILKLYLVDPKIALLGDKEDRQANNAVTLVAIANCLRSKNQHIRELAATSLFKFHQPVYVLDWSPSKNPIETFWKMSSQIMLSLAKQLLDNREKEEGLKCLLELIKKLFESRNEFIRLYQDVAIQGSDSRECIQASVALEVALLILLCSSDMEITSLAISCFGYICDEIELVEGADDLHQISPTVVENLAIFRQLSNKEGIVMGRKSQQKQIRKALRLMSIPSNAKLAAWEEAHKRWRYMTPSLIKPKEESPDEFIHGKQPKQLLSPIQQNSNVPSHSQSHQIHSFHKIGPMPLQTIQQGQQLLNQQKKKTTGPKQQKILPIWHDDTKIQTVPRQSQSMSLPRSDTSMSLPESINTVSLEKNKSAEWLNYSGFLAAMGGICLLADPPVSATSPTSASFKSNLTRRPSVPSEFSTMINKFVVDMVEMLLCDNVVIREWVREILGCDLSPTLYPTLFRQMESILNQYFQEDGEPICNSRNTMFVENAISILRLILDRLDDSAENLLVVDSSRLVSQYARYLSKLEEGPTALKMKIKFCHLIEVMMNKKDRVLLRQEFKLRNRILEIIVEWTSDFALKHEGPLINSAFEANQNEKLHRELDISCLIAIVGLLHQLPLQPPDITREADPTLIKSRIFYKYFTFFLKLLNRCRDSELEIQSESDTRSIYSTKKPKGSLMTYLSPLKESTILAMSNLLSANVDAGLRYSLSMGYHEDYETRTAFIKVLTNILNQGTEFGTLAETVITDRYEKLVDMIVDDENSTIALCLCQVCPASEIEDISGSLLACFSSKGKAMNFIKLVIQQEVQNTSSKSELLRRTSITTKLLSAFVNTHGIEYAVSVLQPVFIELSNLPDDERVFELDLPDTASKELAEKSKKNIFRAAQMILDAICNSVDKAPYVFREISNYIFTSIEKRHPEAKYTGLGNFIFLRFFCPIIASPESEGLVKSPVSREMKRGYVNITKVIQNLANSVLLKAKDQNMTAENEFLSKNLHKITTFLIEMSTIPEIESQNENCVSPSDIENKRGIDTQRMEERDYAALHRALFDNMERISREMAARRFKYSDQETTFTGKRKFDKLSSLLAQLGRPPEVCKVEAKLLSNYTHAASNQMYADFMRRNGSRSLESIISKNIIYEGGVSRFNRPVVYFICRNIVSDSIDFELLLYHILLVIQNMGDKEYELVIDATLFCSSNEIPSQYLNQMIQFFNVDSADNLKNIIVYNPNNQIKRYFKKIPNLFGNRISKRIAFAVTLSELYDYVEPNEVRLPKSTVALDDPCLVFHPVNMLTPSKTNIPVTMKVSSEYIQVMTVRKQEFLNNNTTIMNEVYLISEIDDIISVNTIRGTDVPSEFHFKYRKGKSYHVFSSLQREKIVNIIRQNKRKVETLRPNTMSERIIRPSDVPGRLLNMALLNLGNGESTLRLAAYNLLYSLSITFHFDVDNQLFESRDLCLPSNNLEFIVDISRKIAQNQPDLTLEFLNECIIGFQKSNQLLRYLCLDYMVPWLQNLGRFCRNLGDENDKDIVKTKAILRSLVDMTIISSDMYKIVQDKVWKTISELEDVMNLVLESFIQFSVEHGVGTIQSEAMADTFITLSSISIRGKIVSHLRRVLQKTSFKPTKSLKNHPSWNEISVLVRFVLMLSFNYHGPIKSYIPEIFHIVSILIGIGPSFIRASIHGIVINVIQSLCISISSQSENYKKVQYLLNKLSDSNFRLLFGLNKPQINAYTIVPETLNDNVESVSLFSLETIINSLIECIDYSAPSEDMGNAWRSRWMSLVASTVFQFNPSMQPQAFVVLGCLAKEEVDDDLLYQILVALRGALAIFNHSEPNLVLSIIMCLKRVVRCLSPDSRYILSLFWVAVALVQVNNAVLFPTTVEFLIATLEALEIQGYFDEDHVSKILLSSRVPLASACRKLDGLCGISFDSHFSFALTSILLKGLRHNNTKEIIYQSLNSFLVVECKYSSNLGSVTSQQLGYLAGLLPLAPKTDSIHELFHVIGIDGSSLEENIRGYNGYESILSKVSKSLLDKLKTKDEKTALLFISMLITQLQLIENTNELCFLYNLLSDAASAIPEVFSITYDALLPKMHQILLNSGNQSIVEHIKSILLVACSDDNFLDLTKRSYSTQKDLLQKIGFSSLGDATFGATSTNILQNAKIASEIIDLIIM